MSFSSHIPENDQVFNNADSFAIAFDAAWETLQANETTQVVKDNDEKLKMVLSRVNEHPFMKEFPEKAKQFAEFRIKLLKLK